jgi:hypothetical protein
MNTSTISSDEDARHLLNALATEIPTMGLDPAVAQAEEDAISAIRFLVAQLKERSISFASTDWVRAKNAVENWIRVSA